MTAAPTRMPTIHSRLVLSRLPRMTIATRSAVRNAVPAYIRARTRIPIAASVISTETISSVSRCSQLPSTMCNVGETRIVSAPRYRRRIDVADWNLRLQQLDQSQDRQAQRNHEELRIADVQVPPEQDRRAVQDCRRKNQQT